MGTVNWCGHLTFVPPAHRHEALELNLVQHGSSTYFIDGRRYELQPGHVVVFNLPAPHGDHFHLGPDSVVLSRDATGLANPAAWAALERKGLLQSRFPLGGILTPAGLAYETGLHDQILHRAGH